MATSSTSSSSSSATVGSQQYCHVNAASFVSIKLYDESNYVAWKAQMQYMVKIHDMLGFIDGTLKKPEKYNGSKAVVDDIVLEAKQMEWERSDNLVKRWIFDSLSEDVMSTVDSLRTAHEVWNKLMAKYSVPVYPPTPNACMMLIEFDKYNPLCRALQMGNFDRAEYFLNMDKDALTAKLNSEGHRSLHVAIGNPKDTQVLRGLLERINPIELPDLVDNLNRNALHYAAVLGNKEAARLLVEKNLHLLGTVDQDDYLPIHKAICNSHKTTFRYLLHVCETESVYNPFKDERGALLLCEIIMAGFLDVAYDLLLRYPQLAKTSFPGRAPPLWCIANKRDAYLSAKKYNFYQRYVYSRFDNFDPLCRALHMEDWERAREFLNLGPRAVQLANVNGLHAVDNGMYGTNRDNPITKCIQSCVNHVIKRIIVKLEAVLLDWPCNKHLKKDKVEHCIAFMILRFICVKVGELRSDQDIHYKEAYFTAVKNNTPEVVKQITGTFPQSILMANSDGYMLTQLSIINRSEKIYNFFVHEVTHNRYLHIVTTDKENNNLLHLAGQLAPPHRLNMVTGATLQMQRDLQWFEEVKKLMRPKEREATNINKETPIMVFRKEHEDLRKEGEVWIKKVADSYIITAILIITIVFAAAITVPGGTKGDTGKPFFKTRPIFMVFLISDGISLFTSTISLLFSLSILTAHYAEEDFLSRLPNRLMYGLVMLFISVTMMLIAFGATLHIMFAQENLRIMIAIAAIVCLSIAVFVILQLPLLLDLISSANGHGIFQKQSELRITT